MNRLLLAIVMLCASVASFAVKPPAKPSSLGDSVVCEGGVLKLTNIGKFQNYNRADKATYDGDIFSPKSVHFMPDGSKFYVNSLEGCATIVYNAQGKKIKVIKHEFDSGTGPLWSRPSGYYKFTHYPDGETRSFGGKPVESAFSHGGRYLWVPYYRRTFDINAQDPSAVAVIDTKADSIVRMMETGPLPKMIACSNDGHTMAITHWGNNTVGLVDISSPDPAQWHHLPYVVVVRELNLNFSLTTSVNRDSNSGLLLRGTVFTPDDRYLLVGCMGGGGIAVIDMASRSYKGMIQGVYNARHLVIDHGWLYASVNAAGLVQRVPLDSVMSAIDHGDDNRITLGAKWQVCHVGIGARTIEVSPSGRFVFAACNSGNALYVVDTREMKTIGQIAVDSYPVGLDVSPDGKTVIVTSQALDAVNIFTVEYADYGPEQAAIDEAAKKNADAQAEEEPTADTSKEKNTDNSLFWPAIAGIAIVLVLLSLLTWYIIRKRK